MASAAPAGVETMRPDYKSDLTVDTVAAAGAVRAVKGTTDPTEPDAATARNANIEKDDLGKELIDKLKDFGTKGKGKGKGKGSGYSDSDDIFYYISIIYIIFI